MQLKAKEVIRNKPITLQANKTLYDARNILIRYNISRVVITTKQTGNEDEEEAIGIVTEKDIAQFLFRGMHGRRLNEIRIDELIRNQNLITVNENANLNLCAKLMLDSGVSSIVVTTQNDVSRGSNHILRGIITKSDFLEVYARNYGGKATVNEYMAKKVLTVRPDESVHMALLIMVDSNISRVIVVDDNNKPIGIITSHDLLPASTILRANKITSLPPSTQYRVKTKNEAMTKTTDTTTQYKSNLPYGMKRVVLAEDIMKSYPIMITDYADLIDAALIMRGNMISGLPVVDSSDKLVGIITKTDITRAVADDK
jgi:CBS domain-containing protein